MPLSQDNPSKLLVSANQSYGTYRIQQLNGTTGYVQWRKDVLTVLKHIANKERPVILVGYDIGAWLAMLAAIRAPHRIQAVICLSAQFDCFYR